MVFKKLLGALGMGGPSVDTVLHHPHVRPGENLIGEVRLTGGNQDVDVEHVALGFVTSIETEHDEHAGVEFHRAVVAGRFQLREGENKTIPFELPVPWETPITSVHGQHLHGMTLGVRTELAIAKVADKGDLDPFSVEPLPAQEKVLEAFSQLGFHFKSADLEHGHLHGLHQELPFFQEIEFFPAPQFAGRINEVELTFITGPHGMDVVLEADKRSGLFTPRQDAFGRLHVTHDEALTTDWARHITNWLEQVIEHRGAMGHGGEFAHHPEHGHQGYGHYEDDHRRGSGMGGVIAGAALGAGAGIVGGMVAGEIIEEIFEDDEEEF
ncbi:sporulation-control protein [Saccharopolyspora antimicrobica]|uniref:Sporulation-control protein n=1 Tax=Saccharopolyspora antimicrobica TaxID=455193 RepID=A0A1I5GST4_9PSEU|nr:sporulation protein [Saccharopolyspora antimicrobica]RKT87371.1 sporulation-control protein [Saccharopolyspora antimicrobica]SFO39062.1 sporulation-control protein [Saccharopolyspora antimicrobica]